jgi:hypothetical protein
LPANVSENQETFQFNVPGAAMNSLDANDPTSLNNLINESQAAAAQRFEF